MNKITTFAYDDWYTVKFVVEYMEQDSAVWWVRAIVDVQYRVLPDTRPWWRRWLRPRMQVFDCQETIEAAREQAYEHARKAWHVERNADVRILEVIKSGGEYHASHTVWQGGRWCA